MTLIRRPLNGPVGSSQAGLGIPFAIGAAPGTTIHTLDNTGTGLGGPFPQLISLFVQNPTGGALNVTVVAGNGAPVVIPVAAGTTVHVFDHQPMSRSGTTAPDNTIVATGSGAGLVGWGFIETQT